MLSVPAAVASDVASKVTPIKNGSEQSRHENSCFLLSIIKEYNLITYSYLFWLPHIGMLTTCVWVTSVFNATPQNLLVVIAELQVSEAPLNII